MVDFLQTREKVVYSKYMPFLKRELDQHVERINKILEKVLLFHGKEKSKLEKEEVEYICKSAVLRIFILADNESVAASFLRVSIDIDKKYLAYVDNYFGDPSQNVALMTVKAIFQFGDIVGVTN